MQQHLRDDKPLPGDELPRMVRAASQRSDVEQLLTSQEPVALYLDIDGTLLDVVDAVDRACSTRASQHT